ncbi:hypothetical protein FQR65_LT12025 [Abscondita terminalis]|nr:hypothetical protein FQR65_LT12025 [Abscondita terminalis]
MKFWVFAYFLILLNNRFESNAFNISDVSSVVLDTLKSHVKNHFNVTPECNSDLLLFLSELEKQQEWAIKMLDASSKLQSGILEGNIHDIGAFDECIRIKEELESNKIVGKYCLLHIKTSDFIHSNIHIANVGLRRGICLPDTCSNSDIITMLKNYNITVFLQDSNCQTDSYASTFDTVSLSIIIFFGFIFFIMLASTIYSLATKYISKSKPNLLFSAFCIIQNGRKIFAITNNSNQISCMYGIRAISMVWIILCHLYQIKTQFALQNSFDALKALSDHKLDYIVGGNKTVDTFLLLTGITLSYSFLTLIKNGKFNLFVYYVHRYLRLTPALAALVLFEVGPLKYLYSGPYWPELISYTSHFCSQYWWKTLLYINNYDMNQCVRHSWYLSVDMQLYVISPVILLLLHRKPNLGLSLISLLTVGSMAISFAITWIYNVDSNGTYTNNNRYLEIYHEKTYTRAAPWLIGIVLGYIIYIIQERSIKIVINWIIALGLWVITICFAVFVVFYHIETFDDSKKLENSCYNAFVRTLWSIAVGWIIFACHFGYGGFVNKFLSLPVFQVLSRLTYTNYLIHLIVILIFCAGTRNAEYFSQGKMLYDFWGTYMYTQFASIILSLSFESPMLIIEKIMFSKVQDKAWQITDSYCESYNDTDIFIHSLIENFITKYVQNNYNISRECRNDITLLVDELKKKKSWALRMLDASAKFGSGILDGNTDDYGNFDECISINETINSQNILGRFCIVDINVNLNIDIESLNLPENYVSRAICLPSTCSNSDIATLHQQFNINVTVPDKNCQTRNSLDDNILTLPISIFFGFVSILVILSTTYHYVMENVYKQTSNSILSSFSVIKNIKAIFETTKSSNELSCMHGIRVLSMAWIVVGHMFFTNIQYPPTNKFLVLKALKNHEYDIFLGATKAVDTFFLLSGLTLSYVFLKINTFHKFNLSIFYLHRYLRLTPALGAVILIYIGLLKFMSSGPLWLISSTFYTNTCIEYWWKNVLYINNFDLNRCLAQTWYIAVDTQLYVISPIILILLQRKPKLGLILIGALIVCSSTTSFIITWIYNLGTNNIFMVPEQYLELYYTKPYTRASPWLIGLLLGYLICRIKNNTSKFTLNPFLTTVLWSLSFLILVSFSFYELESYPDDLFTKIRNSLYNSCSRCVWSLGVGWIIFACSFGYGGMINKLLSLPILQILSKLTYTNYLIHVAVITAIYVRLRTVPYFSNSDTINPDMVQAQINKFMKQFLNDYVINNANISSNCQKTLTMWWKEIQEKTPWALKMLDASPKLQSGILEGNIENLGAFDECIGINEKVKSQNILGQYCLINFPIDLKEIINVNDVILNIRQAICIPNSCTHNDLENLINEFNVTVRVPEPNCQTQNSYEIDSLSLTVIIFFGCVALIVIMSTIYDIVAEHILKVKNSILLTAFSILTNGRNLFRVSCNSREIACIHGIRAISMIWIILGHLYRIRTFYPMINKLPSMKAMFDHEYDFVAGATKCVDTFLLLSGFTLSYVFLSSKEKFNLPIFYLHRYLRLTPALGAVILIYVGLLKFMNSGPYWVMSSLLERRVCIEYWWKNMLYINNHDLYPCVAQTWYVAVDMQLYFISPIILIPLRKKPKLGLVLIGALIVSSATTSFIITWINNLATNDMFLDPVQLMEVYYTKSYTRASPWLIGLLVGYLIHKIKNRASKFTLSPLVITFFWSIAFLIMLALGVYEFESYSDDFYTKIRNSLYNACARSIWSLAVAWIIFACSFGYGGIINNFLSLPIFQILSKLTYANYLTHVGVTVAIYGRLRTAPYFSHADTFILFWSIYIYTQFASIILALVFESPIITIEKVIFGKKEKKPEKQELKC